MKHIGKSGAALAAAAFTLALSGTAPMVTTAQAADGMVKCMGVNSCKGHGECATASNSCNGQNACKGQGFISLSKDECDAQGGKVLK
ncbi:hypothetical protein CSC94_13160 [Zhengella mangrovi]|uniref:DUF2282 domain-containing protein n=1 Tax=Zhengella mangrovi TaxID=1982044 RepID=A0A2G1QM71_9HYPH|nr:hypothetical protein [Zhengella mangrovi]PHP66626.1 hypothetical protein CSC94_13160 [Zhengella mangrovi]